eukprot:scaffold212128_cov32-Tisochrysis_lutea.AAC.4
MDRVVFAASLATARRSQAAGSMSLIIGLIGKDDASLTFLFFNPQTARFKAEIHFNPKLLSDKYLAAHNNLAECEEDAKSMFERSAVFLLATLSIEVDRLEHIIRTEYPEFKYIDLEVL